MRIRACHLCFTVAAMLASACTTCTASAQIRQESFQRFGGPQDDWTYAVLFAPSGSHYALGGTESFGGGGLDVLLLKYDSTGALAWARTFGSGGEDYGEGFAGGASESFAIAGTTTGFGASDEDGLFVRVEADGAVGWARRWDSGNGNEGIDGVAIYSASGMELAFCAGETADSGVGFGTDVLLQRYDFATGNLLWSQAWAGLGAGGTSEGANCVGVDPAHGFLYAAGHYEDGGVTNGDDALLIQLDFAGNVLWVRTWDRGGCDDAYNLALDAAGSVYVTGGTLDSDDCDAGGKKVFVTKWSTAGNLVWDRVYSSGEDEGDGLAVEATTGDVYLSGSTLSPAGDLDGLILKLDASGSLHWSRTWGGASDDGVIVAPRGAELVATGATESCEGWLRSCATGALTDPAAVVGAPAGALAPLTLALTSLPTATSSPTSSSCSASDALFLEFASSDTGTPYCFGDGTSTACPCGNAGCAREGCENSSARGAELAASGSSSIGALDLTLFAIGALPGQPGLFFQGENATNAGAGLAFGDGLRCAGGNVIRLQIAVPDGTGEATSTVAVAVQGNVAPGDVRRYQFWYRDPVGSPCGTAFNLSNGLELVWQP